jgi:hypothetical protein
MTARNFFVVRARVPHGTVTYNCPTAEWALRKLRDFHTAGYQIITVAAPDGTALGEADLIVILEQATSNPQPAAIHP